MNFQHQRTLELIHKIFRLDDLLKKAANQITEPLEQTGARWQILNAIEYGPMTVAEIARYKNSTRQSVQRIVNELVLEKIVQLQTNPDHMRFPLVKLTAKGKRIHAQIQDEREAWLRQVLIHLEGEINSQALRFLERFQTAIEKTIKERSRTKSY